MVLKLKFGTLGAHVHVAQFIGPDVDHLARIGEVSMREDEWAAYRDALVGSDALHVIIEPRA